MNVLKKIVFSKFFLATLLLLGVFLFTNDSVVAQSTNCTCLPDGRCFIDGNPANEACIKVDESRLRFRIPNLSEILTFAIRAFFIIAGLAALIFLLLGALAWVTSGGDKENVSKAQSKITNAIIGVILIAVVLAVIVTLEQVVFGGKICLGLSCPITIPSLIR